MSATAVLPVVPSALPGAPEGDPTPVLSRAFSVTSRQLEIIALVVEGRTNQEIAAQLQISSRTVQSHLASAMQRLRATSRTQLAVTALRSGIVPLFPAPSQPEAGGGCPQAA